MIFHPAFIFPLYHASFYGCVQPTEGFPSSSIRRLWYKISISETNQATATAKCARPRWQPDRETTTLPYTEGPTSQH